MIKELPREVFSWNGEDSVYLSKSGVLISVPNEALLQNGKPYKGKAIIEWQEAIDGATIMKSGLSTMADSNLLETQGMFSFRVQTEDGELLDVDEEVGIYVQVPVDQIKPGMELYEGVYDKDSIINWVNPKPLEKLPVPVDMSELDFYPEGYEDTLNKLKLSQRKEFRDSLYLACESFDENRSIYDDTDEPFLLERKMTAKESELIYGENRPIDKNITYSEAIRIKQAGNPENDPYISSLSSTSDTMAWESVDVSVPYDEEGFKYIPPSKVLAFWNEKFNNTILATRDFEKRMLAIHETCDESLLKLYTSNIDKPLYFMDSVAVVRGHAEFNAFFAERVGKLEMKNAHLENLQNIYNKGIKSLRDDIKKQRKKYQEKQVAFDNKLIKERVEQAIRAKNMSENLTSEETRFNLKQDPISNQTAGNNASFISSSSTMIVRQRTRSIGFRVNQNNTIMNVDRKVAFATRNRTNFKGSYGGKKIDVRYNSFDLSVENNIEYSRLYTYLLPDKFNSYQRLKGEKDRFEYRMNEKVIYDVAVLGFNEKGFFYHEIKNINKGSFKKVKLKSISESEFKERIANLNESRLGASSGLEKDLNWLKLEQKNYRLRKDVIENNRLLSRMRRVVFPCMPNESNDSDEKPELEDEVVTSFISEQQVVDYPDLEAQFPGGAAAMNQFLAENINYPEKAMNDGVQGKVFVEFIVEVDGSISNVRVIRGLSPEIDNEAIRVVKSLPRFTPAQINGKNGRSTKRIAVNFSLAE
ncbi:MAG: energy transducer TonB [Brumimicrobium sp.]